MNHINKDEIEKFLEKDIEYLYQLLDVIISSEKDSLYAPGNEKERGIDFIKKITPEIKNKICDEWDFCGKRNDPDIQDSVNLVATLADIMTTILIGVPATLISVILIKKGLIEICNCTD